MSAYSDFTGPFALHELLITRASPRITSNHFLCCTMNSCAGLGFSANVGVERDRAIPGNGVKEYQVLVASF